MGEVYNGKVQPIDMLIPMVTERKPGPSVQIGSPIGSDVAGYYQSILADDFYNYLYFNQFAGFDFDEEYDLDEDGMELY